MREKEEKNTGRYWDYPLLSSDLSLKGSTFQERPLLERSLCASEYNVRIFPFANDDPKQGHVLPKSLSVWRDITIWSNRFSLVYVIDVSWMIHLTDPFELPHLGTESKTLWSQREMLTIAFPFLHSPHTYYPKV
jgi:hypothetical protein